MLDFDKVIRAIFVFYDRDLRVDAFEMQEMVECFFEIAVEITLTKRKPIAVRSVKGDVDEIIGSV